MECNNSSLQALFWQEDIEKALLQKLYVEARGWPISVSEGVDLANSLIDGKSE